MNSKVQSSYPETPIQRQTKIEERLIYYFSAKNKPNSFFFSKKVMKEKFLQLLFLVQ